MKIDKHTLLMIIGCGLPLLFIFLAPVFGISNNISIFIFIVAMFAFHLLIPMHNHGGHQYTHDLEHSTKEKETLKTKNHEHNQH